MNELTETEDGFLLGWPCGRQMLWTDKNDIRDIIKERKKLGMQPKPFTNMGCAFCEKVRGLEFCSDEKFLNVWSEMLENSGGCLTIKNCIENRINKLTR